NTDFLFADSNLSAKEINEYVNGYYKAKIQDRLTTDKKYINYYLSYGVPEIYDEEFFPYSEEEYNTLKELKDDPSFIEAVSYYSIMGNDVLYKIEDNKKYSIYAVYDKIHSWEPKYYDASATEVEEVRNMSQEFDYHDEYIYHFVNTEPIKYDKEKEDLYSRLYKTISYTTKQNHRSEKELEGLTGTKMIKSPSVLEFDFSTIDDSIAFNYVFASQEYPMFVNSQFNDAFAFIITDLTTGKKENIAKIPGSNTYVSINNVNKEKNSKYFVANYESYDPEFSWNPDFTPIYKDCNLEKVGGFTTTLTAKTKVVPCRKYHLKLAIGNAVDDDYQSIVFLEAGSFKSNGLSSKIRYTNSRASGIAKDCSNGEIVIHIKDSDTPTKINLKCIGEAKNGIDYKKIPEEIVIPAHQDTAVIELEPIRAIDKDSMEVQIAITIDNSCSNTQEDTVRTYIYKVVPITIKPNIPECCASVLSVEPQGPIKTITWEPADQLEKNEGTTVTPLQCPDIAETFTITAEDKTGCQQAQETLVLKPCANEIEMSAELVTENGSSELITGCNTGKIVFHINQSIAGKDDVKIGINIPSGYNIEGLPKELTIPASDTTFEIPVTAKIEDTPYHNTFNVEATCEECITEPVSIEITTTQLEPLRLEQENTYKVCEPGGLEVEVKLITGTLGEVIWEPTDLLLSTDSLRATLTEDLDSSVVLTVKATDQTGCLTDVSTINIVKKVCIDLTIPPFFTPDKNGINEIWKVYGLEKSEKSKVRIYDRWGKLLVEFNPNTEGWDGTYNGHPCPSSDYWYVIDCEELDKIYTGHFTLIRK
ncbi:MAG: T9SS type B sorting domain-containing protein, partial [Paludibacteraceae bacterium]|nr:T9SS type B sorting domain-containing protein [Paludibacteraceae bacterium]